MAENADENGWTRFADEQPPTTDMIIWARPNGRGWSLGLAYRTVSGTWADAYGAPMAGATHWKLIGEPPHG